MGLNNGPMLTTTIYVYKALANVYYIKSEKLKTDKLDLSSNTPCKTWEKIRIKRITWKKINDLIKIVDLF